MQKTSLCSIFFASALLCGGAAASLSMQRFMGPSSTRIMATIESHTEEDQLELERSVELEKAPVIPRNFKIASSFKRSRNIWGVYDKTSDHLQVMERPDISPRTVKTQLGELILKDGQIVLISPLSHDGVTQIETVKLPYDKKGKNSFHVNLSRASKVEKEALVRMYRPLISNIEQYDSAQLENMNCQRKNALLSCELNVAVY